MPGIAVERGGIALAAATMRVDRLPHHAIGDTEAIRVESYDDFEYVDAPYDDYQDYEDAPDDD